VTESISRMFVGFREKARDAEMLTGVLLEAVSDLAPWAVIATANRFLLGRVARGNHSFAPTVAEFHVEAERIVAAEAAHQRQVARGKPAPRQISEWQRKKFVANMTGLAEALRSRSEDTRAKARELHRAEIEKASQRHRRKIIAEAEAAGEEPFADAAGTIPVSLALRALVKEQAARGTPEGSAA
jgi:hypothetical protein